MNRMLENYLCCYTSHHQRDWDSFLVSAEFAYDSTEVTSNQYFFFKLDLGWHPQTPLVFISSRSDATVKTVANRRRRLASSFSDASFSPRLAQAQ